LLYGIFLCWKIIALVFFTFTESCHILQYSLNLSKVKFVSGATLLQLEKYKNILNRISCTWRSQLHVLVIIIFIDINFHLLYLYKINISYNTLCSLSCQSQHSYTHKNPCAILVYIKKNPVLYTSIVIKKIYIFYFCIVL
jgi:hypothetical protein